MTGSRLVAPIVLTLVCALTLLAGVPTVHHLRGWFWPLQHKPLAVSWLLLTTVVIVLLLDTAARTRQRPRLVMACLFGIAVAVQFGLALAEGRGLAPLRERAVLSGHASFARTAAEGAPARELLARYEDLAAEHVYLAVKPPGQLLTYVALDRVALLTMPIGLRPITSVDSDRHRRLVELMTWLLPWLAALAVFPLGATLRRLTPDWLPPLTLFALSAPLALITLHLDQALFPTIAATLWWCAARAAQEERPWLVGIAAGGLAWLLAFLSFSTLPAIALAPFVVAAAAAPGTRWRRCLTFVSALAASAAAAALAGFWLMGYDPLHRYAGAIAAHARFKGDTWDLAHVAAAARIDLIEFAWWANPAFALLALAALVATLRRVLARAGDGGDLLVLGIAAIVLAMALLGRTFAETPRLWLFLLPLVLWCATRVLGSVGAGVLALLCGLQWLWTVGLKSAQDFH